MHIVLWYDLIIKREAGVRTEGTMITPAPGLALSSVLRNIWRTGCLSLLLVSCTGSSFQLPPVVPTKQQLPYTAQLRRAELAAYIVEPGATLTPDPHLENHVTRTASTPFLTARQWEETVLEYMRARQTFRRVVEKGAADIGMDVRIFIYIDPGVQSEFSHTYFARSEASVINPHTGGAIDSYSGFGKAMGEGSKDSNEADEGLTRMSIRAALNDLFSKIENDKRLVIP